LSSRPERSVAEGPAVSSGSQTLKALINVAFYGTAEAVVFVRETHRLYSWDQFSHNSVYSLGASANMLTYRLAKILSRAILSLTAAAVLTFTISLHAQQTSIVKLMVEKKPGASDGRAMAAVKGPMKVKGKVVIGEKTGRIATKAVQAWIIMDGQGALLLLSPEKKDQPYRLRYYQLDVGKGRLLGHVPFTEGTIAVRTLPT
jgi:hypothetical protein